LRDLSTWTLTILNWDAGNLVLRPVDYFKILTDINLTADSRETIQAQLNQMQPRHLEDFETAWQEAL
jgi:hypothetical protein